MKALKMNLSTPRLWTALAAAGAIAACESSGGSTAAGSAPSKGEAAQRYAECLLEKYYTAPDPGTASNTALAACSQFGKTYATMLVRDYRTSPSDVRVNVESYMYPRVRDQGAQLLKSLTES